MLSFIIKQDITAKAYYDICIEIARQINAHYGYYAPYQIQIVPDANGGIQYIRHKSVFADCGICKGVMYSFYYVKRSCFSHNKKQIHCSFNVDWTSDVVIIPANTICEMNWTSQWHAEEINILISCMKCQNIILLP